VCGAGRVMRTSFGGTICKTITANISRHMNRRCVFTGRI
jgi:hypothetical protein